MPGARLQFGRRPGGQGGADDVMAAGLPGGAGRVEGEGFARPGPAHHHLDPGAGPGQPGDHGPLLARQRRAAPPAPAPRW